jgi:hypothetical protein
MDDQTMLTPMSPMRLQRLKMDGLARTLESTFDEAEVYA